MNGRAEEAPLFTDGEPSGDADLQRPKSYSIGGSDQNFLQRAWRWLVKHIVMVALILVLIGGGIAVAFYFHFLDTTPQEAEEPDAICTTPACVLAAAAILQNLSPRRHDLDPCTNFDQYVCEGFYEKHDIRPDQSGVSTAALMSESGDQLLRHLLEAPFTEIEPIMADSVTSSDRAIFEKLQASYAACLDEKLLEDIGVAPMAVFYADIKALYPVNETFTPTGSIFPQLRTQSQLGIVVEDSNAITDVISYLISIGTSALIDIGVSADDKDPDVVVPFVYAPRSPGLPSKEYYEDEEVLARYTEATRQTHDAFLKKFNLTAPPDMADHVLKLEAKIARALPDAEDADDVTFYYNPMTFEQAKSLLPQVSLEHLVKSLAPHAPRPSKLIIGAPQYLRDLSQILEETSAETLLAYFLKRAMQRYAYKVEDDALKPLKRFNNELQGKDPDAAEERWRTCVKVADGGLGWILSRFFVQKAFSEESRIFGDNIVSDIKVQFVERLKQVDWMSPEVRELGIEKVHAIVQKIGYPIQSPDIRNASQLEQYYHSVNISSKSYFNNTLSIAKFDTAREWSALGKPTDRAQWDMTADTVNAYYNPPGNEIVFPAGIMQKPVFYDPSVPQYLSYGAFGAVSGHELSHAFDSTGRHYDERGNYTDWWNNATVEAFIHKAQCFVDQYEQFTVPNPHGEDLHVNGKLTLGENIADAGGLNAAFKAWEAKEKKQRGKLLPGLQEFSKEQLFFVNYANWWCGKTRPERAVELVFRDPHSPAWARILGTLDNSRHFKEAFKCSVKEPKCELW